MSAQLSEQQIWHEGEMAKLRAWGDERVEELREHLVTMHEGEMKNVRAWSDAQVEDLRGFLAGQVERERARAERAEQSLSRRPVALPGHRAAGRQTRRLLELAERAARSARRVAGKVKRRAARLLQRFRDRSGRGL